MAQFEKEGMRERGAEQSEKGEERREGGSREGVRGRKYIRTQWEDGL